MISALVHTRNEREHLPGCLESLRWADEIVVADMASTDGTREIAQSMGARVVDMPVHPMVELVRNRATQECRGEWVMVLDADERASPGLARRARELVKAEEVAAYWVPRRNYFLGVWLEHGNWPDSQVRLVRRDKIRWSELIHEHPAADGKMEHLPLNPEEAIEHLYVTNLGKFMTKLAHYAALDAERLDKNNAPSTWPWILRRPLSEFYGRFLTEQAWRHGMHGFVWSGLMAVYQFQVAAHYWDGQRKGAPMEEAKKVRANTRREILRAALKWLR